MIETAELYRFTHRHTYTLHFPLCSFSPPGRPYYSSSTWGKALSGRHSLTALPAIPTYFSHREADKMTGVLYRKKKILTTGELHCIFQWNLKQTNPHWY